MCDDAAVPAVFSKVSVEVPITPTSPQPCRRPSEDCWEGGGRDARRQMARQSADDGSERKRKISSEASSPGGNRPLMQRSGMTMAGGRRPSLQPRGRGRTKHKPGFLPNWQLSSIIKNQCFSVFDLQCVVSDHGSIFTHIHISAAFGMLGNIIKGSDRNDPMDKAAVAELMSSLSGLACSTMEDFDLRGVSNTLHSVAILHRKGHRGQELLINALISHELHLLHNSAGPSSVKPQDLSNTFWALANLGRRDDGFTSALISVARGKLPIFKPQNLTNTIWALATLRHRDDRFTSALISEAQGKLSMFNPQDLSNAIWALATLGHHDLSLIHISEPTRPY